MNIMQGRDTCAGECETEAGCLCQAQGRNCNQGRDCPYRVIGHDEDGEPMYGLPRHEAAALAIFIAAMATISAVILFRALVWAAS